MKRKVQVVIISPQASGEHQVLVFKTNKERGSFWQNVTGSVDEGESFEDAAIRELIEETQIDKETAKNSIRTLDSEFFFTDRKQRKVQEKVYYYLGPSWDVLLCEEHVEYQWINSREIPTDLFKYQSNYQALLKTLELIKS